MAYTLMAGYKPENFSHETNIVTKITYLDSHTPLDPIESITQDKLLENIKSIEVDLHPLENRISELEEEKALIIDFISEKIKTEINLKEEQIK